MWSCQSAGTEQIWMSCVMKSIRSIAPNWWYHSSAAPNYEEGQNVQIAFAMRLAYSVSMYLMNAWIRLSILYVTYKVSVLSFKWRLQIIILWPVPREKLFDFLVFLKVYVGILIIWKTFWKFLRENRANIVIFEKCVN